MERINPIKVSNPKGEKPLQLVEIKIRVPEVHLSRIVKFLEGFQNDADDVPVCTFVNMVLLGIERLGEKNGSDT